ncbi:MAG: TRAP transporter large permease [Paracoccaceae bacterium]
MDATTIGVVAMLAALGLIALRVPIGVALAGLSITCTFLYFGWRFGGDFQAARAVRPTMSLISSNLFQFLHSYSLSMVPLFIGLGHVAYHAEITTKIYYAGRVWLSKVPGGLAMASVMGCGGFSAISGSSIACAAAMGRICVPEMRRYGYSMPLATSAIAAGGTLGSLIPPSILFILYGIFTETSVHKLFLAGVLPGLLSLAGYMVVIFIWAKMKPEAAPAVEQGVTWAERWRATFAAWPALLLFVVIIGGIYGGSFTPTEAAAVSLSFAVVYGFAARKLNWAKFVSAIRETAVQSAAVFFIAAAAKMFVAFVSLTGLTRDFVALTEYYQMSDGLIILMIVALYLVMGMFLDPLGIMLLTLPFVIPLVEGMGLDLIWFGVVVVKLLEIGLITPPVGLNVFVINSVVGPDAPVHRIFRGVMNFLAMDMVVFALIVLFPAISLFLPNAGF